MVVVKTHNICQGVSLVYGCLLLTGCTTTGDVGEGEVYKEPKPLYVAGSPGWIEVKQPFPYECVLEIKEDMSIYLVCRNAEGDFASFGFSSNFVSGSIATLGIKRLMTFYTDSSELGSTYTFETNGCYVELFGNNSDGIPKVRKVFTKSTNWTETIEWKSHRVPVSQ